MRAPPLDVLGCPAQSMGSSVHAVAHRQRRRIGAEAADRRFPHRIGRGIEDDVEIDVAHQPRRMGELVVELTGPPAGVARDHARPRRGPGLQDAAQQPLRCG